MASLVIVLKFQKQFISNRLHLVRGTTGVSVLYLSESGKLMYIQGLFNVRRTRSLL